MTEDSIFSYDAHQIRAWTSWSIEKSEQWREEWNTAIIKWVSQNNSSTTIEYFRLLDDLRESMPTEAARDFREALIEVEDEMTDVTSLHTGVKIAGDTEQFPTGIEKIDDALGGAQRSQLWVHASRHYSRHFIMSIAYEHALKGGRSVIISSERLPQYFRDGLEILHSRHPKFGSVYCATERDPQFLQKVNEDWKRNFGDVMYCNTLDLDRVLNYGVPIVFFDSFLQPGMTPDHAGRVTRALRQYAIDYDIAIVATVEDYNNGIHDKEVFKNADVVTSCTLDTVFNQGHANYREDLTFRCLKSRDVAPFDSFSTRVPEWLNIPWM